MSKRTLKAAEETSNKICAHYDTFGLFPEYAGWIKEALDKERNKTLREAAKIARQYAGGFSMYNISDKILALIEKEKK